MYRLYTRKNYKIPIHTTIFGRPIERHLKRQFKVCVNIHPIAGIRLSSFAISHSKNTSNIPYAISVKRMKYLPFRATKY